MIKYETLKVLLAERSYDIHIGRQLLSNAGALIKPVIRGSRIIIVTDENVAPLYLAPLISSFEAAGIKADSIILPAGEKTKSFVHFENLINQILSKKIDRKVALIALGGGVIGDLTGYVASSVLRGIDFVQIPTTLLSQVDSSVGGKTGINTAHGKNLIGAFYQPRLVLADINTLDSLPKREILAGYAEIVKYGLINDLDFFTWLEESGSQLCAGDKYHRGKAVLISCKSKAKIVMEDETEQDIRALLNLGHTFGHALEAETGFSNKLIHGESVGLGICMAFDLSTKLGLCSNIDTARIRAHFASVGLPTSPLDITGVKWSTDILLDHMLSDKKVEAGNVTFILAKGIGKCFVARDINLDDVRQVIENAIRQE
ncbi:MAG: 3-dehydroquinate synthase [Rhodospirillales bacterium]|jgi:3-dehydroquinate synthase